jgi:hypothetical protein
MEMEFGTGLRAYLERTIEFEVEPPHAPRPLEVLSTPEVAPPRAAAPRADLDARLEALTATEAELMFRERRVADREQAFQVSVQRVVYRLAQEMLEGEVAVVPRDELAVARARRGGFAA